MRDQEIDFPPIAYWEAALILREHYPTFKLFEGVLGYLPEMAAALVKYVCT